MLCLCHACIKIGHQGTTPFLIIVYRSREEFSKFCLPISAQLNCLKNNCKIVFFKIFGCCSSVSIAIGYGLDGPGIESRWEARFSAPVQTGPGAHPASSTMGTGSFPGVKSSWGVMLTPHPTSSAVGHERVELYLYSPYEPYGLYRASVPVQ
jgi:hypothetical protein